MNDIVFCKDCKHRPIPSQAWLDGSRSGFDLEFPDSMCPAYCEDQYYSWYPPDHWYCGNREKKDDKE